MFTLLRYNYGEDLTQGLLLYDNLYICDTLELPWIDNIRNFSCIPEGIFDIEYHQSPKHGPCIAVNNVKDRSAILIHAGNTTIDTEGCILVGVKNRNTVLDSKKTLKTILEILDNRKGTLTIKRI